MKTEPFRSELIYGISENNIFVTGFHVYDKTGALFHYNGTDWHKITAIGDLPQFTPGIWADEENTYICGYTISGFPNKTMIYHGR